MDCSDITWWCGVGLSGHIETQNLVQTVKSTWNSHSPTKLFHFPSTLTFFPRKSLFIWPPNESLFYHKAPTPPEPLNATLHSVFLCMRKLVISCLAVKLSQAHETIFFYYHNLLLLTINETHMLWQTELRNQQTSSEIPFRLFLYLSSFWGKEVDSTHAIVRKKRLRECVKAATYFFLAFRETFRAGENF